ncbi:DNA adenine methylase [Sulfurimonas sp.]|uniref:DNA adenine methylase n=1 Tax=Sulfurimonas sp. TaxID=2022749 RepID=UPI003D11204E
MNTTTKHTKKTTSKQGYTMAQKLNSKNKGTTMEKTTYTALNTKFFTYTGSKAKYQKDFAALHKEVNVTTVDTYIEVFAGTLASALHNLECINAKNIIINDINPHIVNLYTQIKYNPQAVLESLKLLEDTFQAYVPEEFKNMRRIKDKTAREQRAGHLKDFYNQAKDYYNKKEMTAKTAGVMVFLLNRNFNGLYAESKEGNYNSSFNWSTKPLNMDNIEENLINLHNFLTENNVVIENMEALALVEKYKGNKDTFIYLDPPYTDSSVTYNSTNQVADYRTVEAHLHLVAQCKEHFNYVMYSNTEVAEIMKEFEHSVHFHRTNSISGAYKQTKTSNAEMLCFIDTTISAMPSVEELLGAVFLNEMPKVDLLLADNKPANNTKFTSMNITA